MAQSCGCCDPVSLDGISDRFSRLKRLFWLRRLLLSLQESALVSMPTPSFSEQGVPGMTEYLPPWLPVPLAGHAPILSFLGSVLPSCTHVSSSLPSPSSPILQRITGSSKGKGLVFVVITPHVGTCSRVHTSQVRLTAVLLDSCAQRAPCSVCVCTCGR